MSSSSAGAGASADNAATFDFQPGTFISYTSRSYPHERPAKVMNVIREGGKVVHVDLDVGIIHPERQSGPITDLRDVKRIELEKPLSFFEMLDLTRDRDIPMSDVRAIYAILFRDKNNGVPPRDATNSNIVYALKEKIVKLVAYSQLFMMFNYLQVPIPATANYVRPNDRMGVAEIKKNIEILRSHIIENIYLIPLNFAMFCFQIGRAVRKQTEKGYEHHQKCSKPRLLAIQADIQSHASTAWVERLNIAVGENISKVTFVDNIMKLAMQRINTEARIIDLLEQGGIPKPTIPPTWDAYKRRRQLCVWVNDLRYNISPVLIQHVYSRCVDEDTGAKRMRGDVADIMMELSKAVVIKQTLEEDAVQSVSADQSQRVDDDDGDFNIHIGPNVY